MEFTSVSPFKVIGTRPFQASAPPPDTQRLQDEPIDSMSALQKISPEIHQSIFKSLINAMLKDSRHHQDRLIRQIRKGREA
jgi:hypothetical protein